MRLRASLAMWTQRQFWCWAVPTSLAPSFGPAIVHPPALSTDPNLAAFAWLLVAFFHSIRPPVFCSRIEWFFQTWPPRINRAFTKIPIKPATQNLWKGTRPPSNDQPCDNPVIHSGSPTALAGGPPPSAAWRPGGGCDLVILEALPPRGRVGQSDCDEWLRATGGRRREGGQPHPAPLPALNPPPPPIPRSTISPPPPLAAAAGRACLRQG